LTDGSNTRLTVPGSVRAVIDRRLARVSHTCHDALATASVIGARFSVDLLRAASDAGDELAALLDEAAAAHLIIEADTDGPREFAFTHDLVRETLYQGH